MATSTEQPNSQQELSDVVSACAANETPIDIVGGNTSPTYGLPARGEGIELQTAALSRLVDFPSDDMTVTVEAGFVKSDLDQILAEKNLRLAIDVPHADAATLGGIVACNWNGPRRYGLGGIRDAVIGITAVDGRGETFRGGGRVVKNVAGYDFCKLLTGSLGTLAVITELTFKLRPVVERLAWLVVEFADLEQVEPFLAATTTSQTTPSAVELVTRNAVSTIDLENSLADETAYLAAVAIEGSTAEVEWMLKQLQAEWQSVSAGDMQTVADENASQLLNVVTNASAAPAPLAIRAHVLPSRVVDFAKAFVGIDSHGHIVAHAGDGVIDCGFSELPDAGVGKTIISELQPLAERFGGSMVMTANADQVELTSQSVWGSHGNSLTVMQAIKSQFDPHHLLNRGRFVFSG